MAPRRWLLILLALGSLALLAYGGIIWAFSVPVSDEASAAMTLPGGEGPPAGERAIVVPVADARVVRTFADNASASHGHPGDVLALGRLEQSFPASARDVTLVRALAHVAPGANGTVEPAVLNLTGVPAVVDGNATLANYSLDLSALANGSAGFVVKADTAAQPMFVSEEAVIGQVSGYQTPGSLILLFVSSAFGFFVPLLALVLTHRGAGVAGPGIGADAGATAHEGFCRDCRAPLAPAEEFCTRCGAWRPGKGS